jgi:hypothetical protein
VNAFDFTRIFWVLGFSLKIMQSTNDVTEFKSPRAKSRERLKNIGMLGIVAGVGVVLVSIFLSPVSNGEFNAMRGTGSDIITLGFSCILQYKTDTKKSQRILSKVALGLLIVGLIVGVVGAFKPFQIGNFPSI